MNACTTVRRSAARSARNVTIWLVIGCLLLAGRTAAAAKPPDGQAEPILYTVTFPDLARHITQIEISVPTGKRPSIELMMARWTPGFYRLQNYADQLQDLSARTAAGKKLAVTQPRKNRWRIQTEAAPVIFVSYRLSCEGRSVTGNWVSPEHALLNGPATFLTPADHERRPHDVRIQLPGQWKRSITALAAAPDVQPGHYRADDFDTLADSPILAGNPTVAEFEVAGSKHYVVGFGDVGQWDARRTAKDLEKMVRAQQHMWGFLPFRKYVFLCAFRRGAGGLEHKNCTLVTSSPAGMQTPRGYQRWLGMVCHEYFHAYNVKRLRPVELSTLDYENQPRTSGLWVAESLTTYYGDLLLTRAGLAIGKDYLADLSGQIKRLQNTPGRHMQTLAQSSLDVWTTSFSGIGGGAKTVSYYVKGPVVGFLLDAHIRHATGGARSLDDVMKLAYKRYSGRRGFSADEFRAVAEEVAGIDLKEWFRRAITSTQELDYAEALDWFGLRFAPMPTQKSSWALEVRPDATKAQKAHLAAWSGSAR